ncbi:winged helix-turn-helix transcriptional regulator [Sphingobacterium mizutaii]|uniref:winged helix-turn-helix transcriptional regulator n=1 Tax=Sphingobacterium mizutaii TaxID=1010 RepID=UPI0028A7CD4D|nr:winged helix-turn-helix transcriptional regulator [Sphingobacterium mizutaii]
MEYLFQVCDLNTAITMIGSRLKDQIVVFISQGHNLFHLLKNELLNILELVLGRQIKELETHSIIIKKEIPDTVPVGIEYVFTNKGLNLIPVL